MLTEIGGGVGVWEEETAEKEKWGSGLGKGEANGEGENGKTDGPEGVDRKVLGGAPGGGRGPNWDMSGTAIERWSSSERTLWVGPTGGELACKHGLEKCEKDVMSSIHNGCVRKTDMVPSVIQGCET